MGMKVTSWKREDLSVEYALGLGTSSFGGVQNTGLVWW